MIAVTLPYDPCWAPLDWAKQHCPSYITNRTQSIPYRTKYSSFEWANTNKIVYYFGTEKDAMIFSLRWL